MSPPTDSTPDRSDRAETATAVRRRRFLALGAGTATALLAGCTGDSGLSPGGGESPTAGLDGADVETGSFRLLISDQPVAIGDFDSLNVSFDRARIFRGGGDEEPEEGTGTATVSDNGTATASATASANTTASPTMAANETATATVTDTATETSNATASETATEPEESDDGESKGFSVIDLAGATVDLTEVVGDKAIGVFDGELPAGRYTKIELYAADVEGIVEGEAVEVTIPSGKLQIVKPFEVVAGETLSFVFDINVVKKGGTGEYNLLPVISESGVAGKDVPVSEIDGDGAEESEAEEAADEDEDEEPGEASDGGDSGPPDDAGDGQP
ncbi:MAG: DUF4382 domain-containing protein [Halobacteriales archaeon]|nr:DUF4382 domain-containing protein [Halobacteriales archaeon]